MSQDEPSTLPTKLKKQATFDDKIFKPKRKYPSFWSNLKDYFSEYTSATSLHGLQYLGEQKRGLLEKIWWLLVIVASLSTCIFLIAKTYNKWDSSPVIVSFAQTPTPVWEIPFPAVTVCSETKARQRQFNFTHYYHLVKEMKDRGVANITDAELKQYGDIALLCDPHLYHGGNTTTSVDVVDFIEKVAPQFEEVLWACVWTNQNESCDNMFTPLLSEEGQCFTFNMLDRDQIYTNKVFHNKGYLKHGRNSFGWSLEKGYTDLAEIHTYPRRAVSAGAKAGLTILMRAFEQDLDYICRGPVQGFKILLHHPGEVPRVSMQYFRAPLDQEVIVAIKPEMMTTSAGLRDYDPHRRGCYFSSERQLNYYKNYTQQNCEVECLTDFTYKKCGCVAYHMPHPENTPICGSASIECMRDAQIEIVSGQVRKKGKDDDAGAKCDCLPACSSLAYNAETSQSDFNWQDLFSAYKANFSEFPGIRMARVSIFFKEMQFITSERNELYGITDFLANCGGLLGLFIGFSFLSLVETLYFVSIRVLCNLRRYGRHYWSASDDLLNNDAYDRTSIATVDKNKLF